MQLCIFPECDNASAARGLCTKHYARARRNGTVADYPRTKLSPADYGETLTCTSCKETKNLDEFYKRGSGGKRRRSCKACDRTRIAAHAATITRDDPRWVKRRDATLRRKYGIGVEEYDDLARQQSDQCALCNYKPPKDTFLHVDHNHTTKQVRGLLCRLCNTWLGRFEEALSGDFDPVERYLHSSTQPCTFGGGDER